MTDKEAYELLVREFAKFRIGDRVLCDRRSGKWIITHIHFVVRDNYMSVFYSLRKLRKDGKPGSTPILNQPQRWLTLAEETTLS